MRRSRISLDRIRQRDIDTVTGIDEKVFPHPWGRAARGLLGSSALVLPGRPDLPLAL
jgi:hypothetical protein